MTPSPSDTAALVERLRKAALGYGHHLSLFNDAAAALSALAETKARLAHADRVIDRARQLCAAWPPHKEFDTDVVALEVELSMLVYGYDVSAPPAAAERGETT